MPIYDDYPPASLAEIVDRAVAILAPYAGEFDSIAVRGVSGLIVGSPVALALGKPVIIVRKPAEYCHTDTVLSNYEYAGRTYLFLDDFISSGKTYQIVREDMARFTTARYVACYTYRNELLTFAADPRTPGPEINIF